MVRRLLAPLGVAAVLGALSVLGISTASAATGAAGYQVGGAVQSAATPAGGCWCIQDGPVAAAAQR